MINVLMREYNYYTFGNDNGYGTPQLSATPTGTIVMAIHTTSHAIQDNINYTGANYIGLTKSNITDKDVVEYEGIRLKVLYVEKHTRYNQVFMAKI